MWVVVLRMGSIKLIYDTITFDYKNDGKFDGVIEIYYEFIDFKTHSPEPFQYFKNHLDDLGNIKILFSAPYGSGKTTFLSYFFDKYQEQYEVFKLYPVNYSVSHNDDIFKYIKCELLFQLLGRDVEFDKEHFSYFQSCPEFFKNNVHNVLAPFIKLLPIIGKSAYEIYEKLYSLAEKYFDYHKELQKDDKEKVIDYLQEFYDREGSIFEDNFYTQLIRQLIEQLKAKQKQTVLIIDDTDRMDPEHIFRILNVFAAHYDSSEYNQGLSNKFGFDNIIIVCDYSNLRKIFSHRFGADTDFQGYIDKFYSKGIYYYDNHKTISLIIKESFSDNIFYILYIVLNDLLNTGNLSLREVLKIQNININDILQKPFYKDKYLFSYIFELHILMKLTDSASLIQKLQSCKQKLTISDHNKNINYDRIAANAIIPLAAKMKKITNNNGTYTYNSIPYEFSITEDSTSSRPQVKGIRQLNTEIKEASTFTYEDFYNLLIQNIIQFGKTLEQLE